MLIRLVFLSVSTIWILPKTLSFSNSYFFFAYLPFFTMFIIVLHNGVKSILVREAWFVTCIRIEISSSSEMKKCKTFSYAFSGVQIFSLYHTPLLTLPYQWLVYRMEKENPWILRGFCYNCHNFIRFVLMKNTTWSWINVFF